jgi:3-hydroxymyristoyl/3-hydroxydecanoyl-(acyl carrier protein) dehydratase
MTVAREISIATDHPAFAGHFPGNPIVPGVVLIDRALTEIARAAGVSMTAYRLSSVKFLSVVRPGEPLTLTFEVEGSDSMAFELRVHERLVVKGTVAW